MTIEIYSERFLIRELSERDVTLRYLGWLQNQGVRKYIITAGQINGLAGLRKYVQDRIGRDDVLFLGIFDKKSGIHIGNIKYEPVNQSLGYAVMGILIGDHAYRGKGVGTEVLRASARWLNEHRNIRQLLLGVSKDNTVAIASYKKVGFVVTDSPYLQKTVSEQVIMSWDMPD